MKRFLIVLSAGLLCIFTACNDKSKESSGLTEVEQKNLEASRTISKAFETGDITAIDSVVASDFVDHSPTGDNNRDSLKAMIVMMKKEFPDSKMELMKELADGDYVFTQMHITGTSNGAMGMPPGPYDMHAIQVVRFKDGKAVEHWEYMDMKDMTKMMGQMMPADTTKPK